MTVKGIVHGIKDMGGFSFVILRRGAGVLQCIVESDTAAGLKRESAVKVTGEKREEKRAPGGFEICVSDLEILSEPAADLPMQINKGGLKSMSLETDLSLRPMTLRNIRKREIFRLQAGLLQGFREFFSQNGFTEINTPKIVKNGAEGGANIFKLDYFGQKAYLTQSPQFYKQMMIPVFERVYEIGPVFRAEKHDTPRHLNEYLSVDAELAFIEDFYEIMELEKNLLVYAFEFLKEKYEASLEILELELPNIKDIPFIKFKEAKERVSEVFGRKIKEPYDLEPEEERLICELFKGESDFVFVTDYPERKRPFYTMDDSKNPKFTKSFDLLYKGLEITTGGQRIHNYDEQVRKMVRKGLNPQDFEAYLMLHKFGCPPHGGFGMGVERLVMMLMGEKNIRSTSLLPRDTTRLLP